MSVFRAQETVEETVPVSGSSAGVNALGLVVFSMCFGLVIGNMKEQGQALREFFDCLNEAIMRLVAIIIWLVTSFFKWRNFEKYIYFNSTLFIPLKHQFLIISSLGI